MKKKILIIMVVISVLILLIPFPMRIKDGGSVNYKAVLYEITDVKRFNENSSTGYEEGTIIKVLGVEVFNNVSLDVVVNVHHVAGVSMSIM